MQVGGLLWKLMRSALLNAMHFNFSKDSTTFKKLGVYDTNFVHSVRKTGGMGGGGGGGITNL